MSIGPDSPTAEPPPPHEDVVLVGGLWDGWEFVFGTPELQELWYRDRDLVVNQLANDAAAKAFDATEERLDPETLFGSIRRDVRKMADLTTASVYRRRADTSVFEFVRTEPEEVLDRLAQEGHFDGKTCQRGC